jgi:hypothetical protein
MRDMNYSERVNELVVGYANGMITDVELDDMLDLLPNETDIVVDSSDDFDWDVDMEHEQYELEASRYDYL